MFQLFMIWFDLIIAKADDDFPTEAIEPTLKELSQNLRKGSRSGADVNIKIRKLKKFHLMLVNP